MDTKILRAIYEAKRQNLLIAKLNPNTSVLIQDSYAYAYTRRLYPFYQADHDDPYEAVYKITKEFVEKILKHCDDKWLKEEKTTFYELEDKFGREYRGEIISVLRYAFLEQVFDRDFFENLLVECPAEAHGLTRDFDLKDITIF